MSSMFWRLRSILSRSHSTAPSGQNIKIYRVRFLRQPLNPSKVTVIVMAHVAVGVIWASTASAFAKGEPVFIPLGMAQAVPAKPYGKEDPEVKAYQRFSKDREQVSRVRAIFREQAIEALRRAFKEKLGREVKSDASLLYFHFPPAPPPVYVQKGIEIAYETDEDPDSDRRYLTFTLTTREWDHSQILINDQIMYPSWMLPAVTNMFRNLLDLKWEDIKSILDKDSKVTHSSIATQFKNDLRKNRPKSPVPRGHIVIDGMVQVISEKMIVNVDLTGSFNPHNFNDRTVQRMSVRFVGHIRRPAKPIELAPIPYPKQSPSVTAAPNTPSPPESTVAEKLAPVEQPPAESVTPKPSKKLAGALASAVPPSLPVKPTPDSTPKITPTPAPEAAANDTPEEERKGVKPPSPKLPPPVSPLLFPLYSSLSYSLRYLTAEHQSRLRALSAAESTATINKDTSALSEIRRQREEEVKNYEDELRRTHKQWSEIRARFEGDIMSAWRNPEDPEKRKEIERREKMHEEEVERAMAEAMEGVGRLGGLMGRVGEEWMRMERELEEEENKGEKGGQGTKGDMKGSEKGWRGKGMRRVLVVRNGEIVRDEVERWGDEEDGEGRIEEVKEDEEERR